MTDTEEVVMNGEGEASKSVTPAGVKSEVQDESEMEVEGTSDDPTASVDATNATLEEEEGGYLTNSPEMISAFPDSSQQGDEVHTEEDEDTQDKVKTMQETPEDSNAATIDEEMQEGINVVEEEEDDDDDEKQLEISESVPIMDEQEDATTPDDNEGDEDHNADESTSLIDADEEQNNGEDSMSEPVLLTNSANTGKATSGVNRQPTTSSSTIRNGEADLSKSKPLLSGLLIRTDPAVSSSSNSQEPTAASPKSRSFSFADGNIIMKELEQQVNKLNQLLSLKEKEWSAILRLKKHVEYALDQVKCTQRITNLQDGIAKGPMSTTDIKACMNLIVSDKETFNMAERQMEESIENAESENKSLQSVFPFQSQCQVATDGTSTTAATKDEPLTASAALQKLCERKRKAMDELGPASTSRIRIVDVQSSTPQQLQSKVIGNGRKGAIVDVQSIIQSHRNLTGDKLDKQRQKKKMACSQLIDFTSNRQYLKTLEDIVAIIEAEKQQKDTPAPPPVAAPAPTPQVIRSITPKPKNGKPVRQPGSNSLLVNPLPSGSGTLAKMLSPSTHSTVGNNRGSNDVTTSSPKYTSKLPNADTNLSLANLLATSKMETKVTMSKIKKERNVREEDTSHVPSQTEAVPICQGCNLSRAQFVCAGCANQWYCSRECQVAAWDEHSEICSG